MKKTVILLTILILFLVTIWAGLESRQRPDNYVIWLDQPVETDHLILQKSWTDE